MHAHHEEVFALKRTLTTASAHCYRTIYLLSAGSATRSESYSVLPVIITLLSSISDKNVQRSRLGDYDLTFYSEQLNNKDCLEKIQIEPDHFADVTAV